MEANRQYFESLKAVEEAKATALLKLLNYLGPEPEPMVADSFYLWFEKTGDISPSAPKNVILSEVINSDNLQLILDKSLKNILTDYHARLNHLAEDYQYRIKQLAVT